MRRLAIIILLVSACGDSEPRDSCGPQAVEVSYDNSYGGLGAENVQDAIDELAARPIAEEPLARRLYYGESSGIPAPEPGLYVVTAYCREGDLALSGSCLTFDSWDGSSSDSVQVVSFGQYTAPNEWRCEYLRTRLVEEYSPIFARTLCLEVSVELPPLE